MAKSIVLAEMFLDVVHDEVCDGIASMAYPSPTFGIKYWTEYNIKVHLSGMMKFAKKIEFNCDDFEKDFNELKTFGGWLVKDDEGGDDNSMFKNHNGALTRMLHTHLPELRRRLEELCEKYGLSYSIDNKYQL